MTAAARQPKQGDRIEFLSDALTDKGPAAGTVDSTKITVDGMYLTVKFADGQEQFSWDDLQDAGADVRGDLWLVKAHVKGHMRHGHYVAPYERGEAEHLPPHPHPKLDEEGKAVVIKRPHHPSVPATWDSPHAVATFVPGGDVPTGLHGVPFRAWKDAPKTDDGWEYSDCINDDLDEPPFHPKPGKGVGAGVVIEEPDGRCWIVHPTNQFGSYRATWPKGTADPGMSLQGTAAKECYEESGLKIRITGFIGDFERTTSVARMYRAVRIGGDPTDCGWETQGVSLVPKHLLYDHLNGAADHPIAELIGAGPAPKKPTPPKKPDLFGG